MQSYKVHKIVYNNEEDWAVFENAHEPIIDRETWERVQELRKQDCYICGSYKKRTKDCTAHFIRTDLLMAGVIQNLRKVTSYAANHEARFVKLITSQNEAGSKRKAAAMKKSMEEMQSRIADLNKIIKRLYEDNVLGKITGL